MNFFTVLMPTINYYDMQIIMKLFLLSLVIIFTSFVYALDNPEAKNYIAKFKTEAEVYEAKIEYSTSKSIDLRKAYFEYVQFLEKELAEANKEIFKNLSDAKLKQAFIKSENTWDIYKKQEFEFVDRMFTRNTVGSSYILSRGSAKVNVLKQHVIQLYRYLQHFSAF